MPIVSSKSKAARLVYQFAGIAAVVFSFIGCEIVRAAETVKVADGYIVEVDRGVTGTLRLAHSFGLIYSPIMITRALRVMETKYPNAKIEWVQIFTTAQMRDAMLADQLDVNSCSAGPFFQGWDKGVDWKILQVVSGFDGFLMVRPDGPDTILDFIGTTMKISPGPNTAQYFVAQTLLSRAGRDVDALKTNWANLPHPDALQSLLSGQLAGHFATADFALRAQKLGMKKIASFREVSGGSYSPIGVCVLTAVAAKKPQLVRGYAEALVQTIGWMGKGPEAAAKVLSEISKKKASPAEYLEYLRSDVFITQTRDANFQAEALILHKLGAIKRVPSDPREIYVYPGEAGSVW